MLQNSMETSDVRAPGTQVPPHLSHGRHWSLIMILFLLSSEGANQNPVHPSCAPSCSLTDMISVMLLLRQNGENIECQNLDAGANLDSSLHLPSFKSIFWLKELTLVYKMLSPYSINLWNKIITVILQVMNMRLSVTYPNR